MKSLTRSMYVCVGAALLISSAAQASIVDHGDYLTDTSTGLDWLDVTKTLGMSVSDVIGLQGTGGQLEGWRYATGMEFNGLVSDFTGVAISPTEYYYVNQEVDRIDGLVELLGSTLDAAWLKQFGKTYDAEIFRQEGYGLDSTLGFLADTQVSGAHWLAMIEDNETTHNLGSYLDYSWAHYEGQTAPFGSFLVRSTGSPVPEPASIALVALGLFGLAGTRKKSHRQD